MVKRADTFEMAIGVQGGNQTSLLIKRQRKSLGICPKFLL